MFCPRAGPSLQAQEPRLQFCRRQVFHCKTQEPRLQFYQGFNRFGSFPLFSASHSLSSAPEQILKNLKRCQDTILEVRRVDLPNWILRTSPKFTTGVKYQFHQGFDQISDPEIPINLRPHRK